MKSLEPRPELDPRIAREAREGEQMAALRQLLETELEQRLLIAPTNMWPAVATFPPGEKCEIAQ